MHWSASASKQALQWSGIMAVQDQFRKCLFKILSFEKGWLSEQGRIDRGRDGGDEEGEGV